MMRIGTYSFFFFRAPPMFFSYASLFTLCRFFSFSYASLFTLCRFFSFFGDGGANCGLRGPPPTATLTRWDPTFSTTCCSSTRSGDALSGR